MPDFSDLSPLVLFLIRAGIEHVQAERRRSGAELAAIFAHAGVQFDENEFNLLSDLAHADSKDTNPLPPPEG